MDLGEGWTLASFVVRPDGTVGDIFIEDSFGGPAFDEASLEALAKWRYAPAELNGEKVEQCHSQVLLTYHIDQKPGAGHAFIKRYKKAVGTLAGGDAEEAEALIAKLEPKSLYEAARVALLRAKLAESRGDSVERARQLSHASIGDGRFLEEPIYVQVLAQRYALAVEVNDFQGARIIYRKLQALDLDEFPAGIEAAHEQVEAAITGDKLIAVRGVLPPLRDGRTGHSKWQHGLIRNMVGLEEVDGKIDHVDLRCSFHRATWDVKPGRAWKIPAQWGGCWLYVFGEPGTTFRLIEYPDDTET